MKKCILLLTFLFQFTVLTAQQSNYDLYKLCIDNLPSEAGLRAFDSLYLINLSKLPFPEKAKSTTLPAIVDNSTLPFLRPVIDQGMVPFCEQAASIGYAFTYEMAHARNISADTCTNQYPLSFAYNFESSGIYGGVSFFYSLEILKKCGCMTISDYGGLSDNGTRWISGYDWYYNGMHNRLDDVFTINTKTLEGLQTLKHWIYNHIGESSTGGVAIFQAGSAWNYRFLAPGTPEQGRPVMTNFSYPATHTMTIVGYNDSIKYDYNLDGKYTNNVDLNGDGNLDVRDWEIGAFRFVNSAGNSWPTAADSGFCYMMYRTLAEDYHHGGIWNNCVQVQKVKANYSPLLTMKVKIKDNQRNSLRLRAGVSNDPGSLIPDQIIDFPIFNFQGNIYPMQGEGTSDTLETIEFGLDITPLLSYVKANHEAAFFLVADEYDPFSIANGSIEGLSVIDYNATPPRHFECPQTPVEITNNTSTYARVIASPGYNKVQINNTSLPTFIAGNPYTMQLNASGGKPPYKWSVQYDYTKLQKNTSTPTFAGTKLVAEQPSDSTAAIPLGFTFPFYGKKYDTVFVNLTNGYLQFTNDKIPWPYLTREKPLLQNYELIIPLTNTLLNISDASEGAWCELKPAEAKFKWKLSKKTINSLIQYEFQVRLFPDGTIEFWHDSIAISNYEMFYSGISSGDKSNFRITEYQNSNSANIFNTDIYIPGMYPDSLRVDQQGLLECIPATNDIIYKIPVKVSDYNLTCDEREFEITSGVHIDLKLHSGNDSILSQGEVVNADLVITNLTDQSYHGLSSTLSIDDQFISPSDTNEIINKLNPFEVITIPSAFRFNINNPIVDPHNILIGMCLEGNMISIKNVFPKEIFSSSLKSVGLQCIKSNNELIRPGETTGFVYHFINNGHSTANDLCIKINILNPEANLISPDNLTLGNIVPGQKGFFEFDVSADDSAYLGTLIPVEVILTSGNQIKLKDTLFFRIGKLPAIVVDMDPNHESAPEIYQQIKNLNYICEYSTTFPQHLYQYQSVFLNLGKHSNRHKLSYAEALALSGYLDQGGNLYLESPNFWKNDMITKLNTYFEFTGTAKTHVYDTLTGSPGSFTEGYRFYNTDFQMNTHYLLPYNKGKPILQDGTFYSAVATDGGKHKTIGSLFTIKGMQGLTDSSTRKNLVKKYIDYFMLKRNAFGISETDAILNTGKIIIYPNPSSYSVNLAFTSDDKLSSSITIFDIQGNIVIELADQIVSDKLHHTEWNLCRKTGERVPPGLYFCRIITHKCILAGKFLVK